MNRGKSKAFDLALVCSLGGVQAEAKFTWVQFHMSPGAPKIKTALNCSLLTYRVIHAQENQQGDGGHSSVDPFLQRHKAIPVVVHRLQHLLQDLWNPEGNNCPLSSSTSQPPHMLPTCLF